MLHALKILGEVILGLGVLAAVTAVVCFIAFVVLVYWDGANGKNPFQ